MKTILSLGLSFLFLLTIAPTGFAQVIKDSKANTKLNSKLNTTVIKDAKIDNSKLIIQNQIPEFTNVKPTSLKPTQLNSGFQTKQFQQPRLIQNNQLIARETASVNSIMTPRDPYHSSLAYIEVLSGDVNPATNEVTCDCGNGGLTYVKLNLRATASKRYLVTIDHSPIGANHGLALFASGFVHQAGATHPHTKTDIVLSASESGMITLWMQCSDPNGAKRKWKFHSVELKELE